MKLIERLGHPGPEAHNRLTGAMAQGLRHAVVGIGFGNVVDGLRVNMQATRVAGWTPGQLSVIVDASSTSASRQPRYGEVPKFGVDGKQLFAWRRRSAFLRWYGRANQGLLGASNENGSGHDGISLLDATDGSPYIPAAFPVSGYAGTDGINFDVPAPSGLTGFKRDYYAEAGAYPSLFMMSDVDPDDLIIGDWGAEFRDGFSFQTISGAWVDGWSVSPLNPGGVLWNAVHHEDGFLFENYPFTLPSPTMTGPSVVAATGKAFASINATVQVLNLFDPDNGGNFFGMIPDGAIIHSARAEIRLDSLTGERAEFRWQCVDGTVSPESGFPVEESVPPAIRFALIGGRRQGTGISAGTRWEPLAVSVDNATFTTDKFQVLDIAPIVRAWLTEIRRSKYHVLGLMPIVGTEPVGFDSSPQQLLRAMFQQHEYGIYSAASRTTAGARGGAAYYSASGNGAGNVDKVFESVRKQAAISWGGLQGGLCHVEWSMPEDWAGRDVLRENWPPLVSI